MLPRLLLCFLALAMSSCSKRDPVADDANAANSLPLVNHAGPDPHGAPPEKGAAPARSLPAPAATIPAALVGRWGLTPADCTSTRGDAKGLMTIGDTSIRFYESTATLEEQRPAIATSFSGRFAFRGEGQSWEKVMTFTRTGDRLERADPEGRFTYTRCA
jgi:hypothetical protein